jgi:N-acetylmuramoyl-L-alanine amidase
LRARREHPHSPVAPNLPSLRKISKTQLILVTIELALPRAVTPIRRLILQTASAFFLSTAICRAQTPAPAQATPTVPVAPQPQSIALTPPRTLPAFYRNLILLDPAHGGPDTGAHLPDNAIEKAITLAFAQRLRPIIAAQGFTVISTRDSDPTADLPADQRAGIANHNRPLACILRAFSRGRPPRPPLCP